MFRAVAQPGSAQQWGCWGRRFKSSPPDQKSLVNLELLFYNLVESPAPDVERLCRGCGQVLDLNCFAMKWRTRGIRHTRCRTCVSQLTRLHYLGNRTAYKARAAASNAITKAQNRARLRSLLSGAVCLDCGVRDLAVLEFDHRKPQDKRNDVSSLIGTAFSWASISREIAKCDVVCPNCHRKRTARHFGWRRLLGLEDLELPPLPKRGTPTYERIKSIRSRRARRHRNRLHVLTYLREHPCATCGESDPCVLEFDHLADKSRDVMVIAMHGGTAVLLAEIEKCRVLCANCHRRHTAAMAGRDR
jgi:hypothetical protein